MMKRSYKLTLFGRSYLVIGSLLLLNLISWITALGLFASDPVRRRVLALCTVAWTLGLRHALDADHISAIDNATRQLVAKGQRPLTCGLFFSFGHSTIVISVTIAIAIATSVANKLDPVSSIGGVVGISVSASFLCLLGCINSYILHRILKERRRVKAGLVDPDAPKPAHGFVARLVLPLLRLIDRPWKLYPIGILFGFGFDTASEIALLAVTAIATTARGGGIPSSQIIILPVLFTSGMSLVDTIDSTLMLWGYALPEEGEEKWNILFKKREAISHEEEERIQGDPSAGSPVLPVQTPLHHRIWNRLTHRNRASTEAKQVDSSEVNEKAAGEGDVQPVRNFDAGLDKDMAEKDPDLEKGALPGTFPENDPALLPKRKTPTVHSELSIALTIISIVVAFSISLIEFMGIALEECHKCADAAENDPGLSGNWWRFWGTLNDNSGYIGAAIVGVMLACGIAFILLRRYRNKRPVRKQLEETNEVEEVGGKVDTPTAEAVARPEEISNSTVAFSSEDDEIRRAD